MKLIVEGHLVPLDATNPQQHFPGRILIEDGRIEAVHRCSQALPAAFANAARVDVGNDFVYPGLIDLHSHLAYNSLPLWTHPGERKPFLNRNIWPGRSSYKPLVSWPAWLLAKGAPEALLAYVQVRALAGGTTTIQGWPGANRNPVNKLLRSADDEIIDNVKDAVRTSVMTLSTEQLRERQPFLRHGGFIYHCSEGQADSTVVQEFEDVADANCLRQRLIAIHCCAIGPEHFALWRSRSLAAGDAGPGTLVWSPFSNLWLYGETSDVPSARANGINICLGTDWGPSGTKNLLGELKVARIVSDSRGWGFGDFDLVEMVTANPGDAMSRCWSGAGVEPLPVGRLMPRGIADIAIITRYHDNPWTNLVQAREEDMRLVLVGGEPRFGEAAMMKRAGARRTTSVRVGATRKRTVLMQPEDAQLPVPERRLWTYKAVLDALKAVIADPRGSVQAATGSRDLASAAVLARTGPRGDPLIIELDMPGGIGQAAGKPPDDVDVAIPALGSIRHDRPWRSTLKGRGFHGGLLDAIDDFYGPRR